MRLAHGQTCASYDAGDGSSQLCGRCKSERGALSNPRERTSSKDLIDGAGNTLISSVDGNQDFDFVAANTPGTVSNSITWTESGGNTNVSLDTNGIAGAEMMVVLTDIGLNLTAADFIL